MAEEAETIAGVPLGLSRDYDRLPKTGPDRRICCSICYRPHDDVERQLSDGCRVLAVMCRPCREEGRTKWIAAQVVALPRAIAIRR